MIHRFEVPVVGGWWHSPVLDEAITRANQPDAQGRLRARYADGSVSEFIPAERRSEPREERAA